VRTVLIVEPNEHVVEGYRRLLRVFSTSWSLRFAADAGSALELVDQGGVAAVIMDSRTPGLDTLLETLRARLPTVSRVVLAGADAMPEAVLRLTLVAHQVLKKPFIPLQLFDLVERTCEVTDALGTERLKVVLGQLGTLPAVPETYARISALTQDPDVSMDAVATVVEHDPAISGAVLRIINSAYFGLPRRVSSVRETVRYLGIQPLKNLVLAVEVFGGAASGRAAEAMQVEALARAMAMRELLGRTSLAEAAFAAGVLADLGLLLLVTRLPIDAAAIDKLAGQGLAPWEAELARFGCTHAELGGAILSRWNLPAAMVEAVTLHHRAPTMAPAPSVATALALVTALEYAPRVRTELRAGLEATAARLATAFPTVTLEQVARHLGPGTRSVG
jgi:HD-like signal output (HDOD) protein